MVPTALISYVESISDPNSSGTPAPEWAGLPGGFLSLGVVRASEPQPWHVHGSPANGWPVGPFPVYWFFRMMLSLVDAG